MGCFMGGPAGYWPGFADTLALADNKAATDIFFHLSIMTPEQQKEIPSYIFQALHVWHSRSHTGLGPGTIACVHAENPQLVAGATAALRVRINDGTLSDWSDTHPNVAEAEAVRRASYFAGLAGNRLYLVHMSTKESVESLSEIKPRSPLIFAETTSTYLSVSRQSDLGLVAKMVPPFREEASVEALWSAIELGLIATPSARTTLP